MSFWILLLLNRNEHCDNLIITYWQWNQDLTPSSDALVQGKNILLVTLVLKRHLSLSISYCWSVLDSIPIIRWWISLLWYEAKSILESVPMVNIVKLSLLHRASISYPPEPSSFAVLPSSSSSSMPVNFNPTDPTTIFPTVPPGACPPTDKGPEYTKSYFIGSQCSAS